MCDEDVIHSLHHLIGFGNKRGPIAGNKQGAKPSYSWYAGRKEQVYAICAALYQWMGLRRRERILGVLNAVRTEGNKRWKHGTVTGASQDCFPE